MSVAKASIGNSSFIGAFAIATDMYSLLSSRATVNEEKYIRDTLQTKVIRTTVDGSDLIGVYIAANSKGLLIPEMSEKSEVNNLKAQLSEIQVGVMGSDLNALRNNILVNDKIAFVNTLFNRNEIKIIEDTLDVEVIKRNLGGFETVGASNIITNRGMVLCNDASDDDIDTVKKFVKSVSQSTANLGSSSIGLCAIANSKGMLVGDETTGFEIARLSEGLDLSD